MAVKKVLCPIDFSPQSDAALDYAVSVARDAGAELILLHIAEPLISANALPVAPDTAKCRRELNLIAVDMAVPVRRVVKVGSPAERILDEASRENPDLIVMGTHGRTGLSHVLMGSIAEYIVRKAPCPVLTLKSASRVAAKAT